MLSRKPERHKLQRGTLRGRESGENTSMKIQLNGAPQDIEPGTRLTALLLHEGLAERRVAVEVNGAIVPRGLHIEHVLHEGDRVEIVHALGGG